MFHAPAYNLFMTIQKMHLGADVTIGMSAHGNRETTARALDALFGSAEGEFELLLVDDCSPDDVLELFLKVRHQHPNTRILSFQQNLEYSGSLNAIFSHAKGRWVLFLSNDIFVSPSYLREIFEIAQSDPSFGIVRGVSNFVDNGLATHNIAFPAGPVNLERLFYFGEEHAATCSGQYCYDTYLTGDAFLVSRAVFDKIGTLDPLFFGYFPDFDFGLRARLAGFKLVLAQAAYAMHQRSANFDYLPETLRDMKLGLRWAKVFENWARFKMKYGLPVELQLGSTNDIPWDDLCSRPFSAQTCYVAPGDYSEYFR